MSSKESGYAMVVTTCSSETEAQGIAAVVVEKRLAACAQVSGPITSFYWWEGRLEKDQEWQVKLKMPVENFEKACELIKQHHSYEVPQIVSIKLDDLLPEYARWIDEETT